MKQAKMVLNANAERVIKIIFPFTYEDLDRVRSIPGRKYHLEEKCWSAPLHIETLEQLQNWQFEIDEELKNYIHKIDKRKAEILTKDIQGLKLKPYPFQNEAVAFIENRNGRALVADDQGLGKTITTLTYLCLHPELRPVLIVCPASLKLNWEREIFRCLENPKTKILSGTKTHKITGEIVIVNYDILSHWKDILKTSGFKLIAFDEAQAIKNNSAIRTKAAKIIYKKIPKVLGLTGTPIESRPAELYNIINMIDPALFPNRWFYLNHFCNPKFNGFGTTFNGATNVGELHSVLKRIMIRRKKSEVLKDLPEKTYSFVPMELSNSDVYQEAEKDFISWVKKEKGLEAAEKASNAKTFASIEGLKQLSAKGKMKSVISWITDFLECDEKLVVFINHKFVMDILIETFGGIAVKVDGSCSMNQRQEAIDSFQNNPEIKLFIGNIQAAGVGITLTAASKVAFVEYPWTPAALDQAADRVHRIGQKNAVIIYYLLARGTIEEKIATLIDNKRKIISGILDGKEVDENSLLTELINQYV